MKKIEKFSTNDTVIPYRLDIAAIDMLKNHYGELYEILLERVDGIRSPEAEIEEKEIVFEEIKMILKELEAFIGQKEESEESEDKESLEVAQDFFDKFKKLLFGNFKVKKEASKKQSENLVMDVLEDYAEKIVKALKRYHSNLSYTVTQTGKCGEIIIKDGKPIIYVSINDNLNVNNIMACDALNDIYPFNKINFYHKYWKPIFESVGHFYIDDFGVLILAKKNELPDYSDNGAKTSRLDGWDIDGKEYQAVNISFKGADPIWYFEAGRECTASKHVSKYTEQDYMENPIVKCIDSSLKSIFGRTGTITKVIPREDHIEVDVNFGRGIDTVRVSEEQIEIVY